MEKNNNSKKVLIASLITVAFILSLVVGIVVGLNQKANSTAGNEQIASEEKNKKTEKKEEYIKEKKEEFNINTKEDIKQKEAEEDSKIEKENYSEDYKKYLEKTEEEKKEIDVIPRKREVKEEELEKIIEKEQEIIEENKEQEEKKIDEQNQEPENKDINPKTGLPYKFNLKDVIPIKVEHQGGFGLCWDFASMNCVETNLALTQEKYYDFSEIHVDYLASKQLTGGDRDIHDGGSFEVFMEYVKNFNGFIGEEELEYRDYSKDEYLSFLNMDKIDESVYECVDFPNYNKEYSDWTEEQFIEYQNAIKNHIMNFGSLYFATEAPPGNTYEIYSADQKDVSDNPIKEGHAMSIVGWDDNYPKEKFTSRSGKHPEKDGAYIILNSWGEGYGEGGYCYISYEDYSVHKDISGVISTNKKDLINLSEIKNTALSNYLEKEFKDRIIVYGNNKYLSRMNLDSYEYDLSNIGLSSLDGIEIFENAYSLNLSNNRLTDVSDLNNSKFKNLGKVDLSNNPNVTGWENLTNVSSLNLRNCNITDISGLNSWIDKGYIYLDLSDNPNITGLEVLKNLKISTLKLANCNIKDLSEFENDNIWELDLSGNKEIMDIEKLNEFAELSYLVLKDSDIKDASLFENCKYFDIVDLSENKGITNVNKIKTEYLVLENCDIETVEEFTDSNMYYSLNLKNNKIKDVTPLNDVMIQELLLSGNKNITGDLSNSRVSLLELNNCNLDDDFNFFNLKSIEGLYLEGNSITLQNVLSKIDFYWLGIDDIINEKDLSNLNIKEESTINKLIIEKTVKVPNGNLRIFLSDIVEGNVTNRVTVENGIYNSAYRYVEFNSKNTNKVTIEGYNDWDNSHVCEATYIINFIADDTMKPTRIIATKPLNKTVYNTGEDFSAKGLEVSEVYGDGIYKKINDYELIVPEQFSFGTNEIKIVKGDTEGVLKIDYLGTENEVDTITITFKTKEMFERATSLFDMEILQADINNKTMILSGKAKTKLSNAAVYINDSLLDDIDSLRNLEIKEFAIQYYGNKITIEDLQRIKNAFPNMTKLWIDNYTDEPNENVVPEQDLFEITVFKDDSVG